MNGASPLTAVLALAAVVGLILLTRSALPLLPVLARAAARGGLGAAAPGDGVALEQTLALDARRRLLLLRCGGRRLLLLTGGPQDVVVGWLDPAPGRDGPPP
jgi:flagellar protein FliO/FliZ